MRNKILLVIMFNSGLGIFAQDGINLSRMHSNLEFYQFNGNEHAIHSVTNGQLMFGKNDFVNIEIIGAYYNNDGQTYYTPGDFSISYRKDYSSKNDGRWLGISPSVKLIIPTGDPKHSALFGHWILEPAIQYSWKLKNENFFISNRWRYNFPLANAGNWEEPPIFVRFEPQIGYNHEKWSTSFTLDNRMVFNQNAFVIFARLDASYKINDKIGINAFYTRRIRNTNLFNTYAGIGLYLNF
ncbi:hypothetical protein E9993_05190 [Labilibacter sediminis]|nr:hypothetical protein E9993_05190 [Labilibacter sediminis]